MSGLRRLRIFWIPWVTMMVLGCFSDAVAQTSYKVTDLGTEGNDILGCAMSLNDLGWTEVMAQNLPPGEQDSLVGTLLNGRLFLDIDGFKLDLGTPHGFLLWSRRDEVAEAVRSCETPHHPCCCLRGRARNESSPQVRSSFQSRRPHLTRQFQEQMAHMRTTKAGATSRDLGSSTRPRE